MFRVNAEASTYDDACSIYSEAELDLVASLNGERAGAGVGELLLDGAISAVAQAHSEEMATTGTVSNVPVETLRERLADRDAVGQNVGSGSGVDALATAFMDSTTHRRTIVGMDYDRIGVGTTSYQGRTWVTLIFATASSADEGRSVDGCPPDIEETTR